jgi:hypothetical protein
VVVCIANLLSCKYKRLGQMKIGYSYDPDTTVSYCPFFLFAKRRKRVQISWMDASLIRVAPEYHDTGRLVCLYRGTLR